MLTCIRLYTVCTVLLLSCAASYAQDRSNFVPVPMNWDEVPNTVFDLSGYLSAPAGKDGHIRVQGEQFVKPDGTRFKAWGVNFRESFFFMPKEEAERIAASFARFGFTCVRFHSIDGWNRAHLFPNPRNTTEWSAERLDQFDYFVYQLKKHGIYVTFTINAYRVFRADDGVTDYDQIGFGKPIYYFYPKVQEHFFDFARRLLTHKNPYTGYEYRHEPAVMFVEFLNENSIFEAWTFGRLIPNERPTASTAWRSLTPYYADYLRTLWNEWLEKNVSAEKRQEWAAALNSTDGKVPQSSGRDWARMSDEHFQAELRFFTELEQSFFDKAYKLLRDELGVKALITGDSDHNDWLSQFPHQITFNLGGDFMSAHGYWDHADWGPPPRVNRQNPMVNDPLDSSYNQFARAPMKGVPFTINETNTFFPHPFAGEHTPILTAYSLLQDWDGIHWFTWGHGMRRNGSSPPEMLSTSDPVRFANTIISGIMFHRKDIATANKTVVRTKTLADAMDSLRWDRPTNRPFYTKGFALSTPLQHRVLWQLVEEGDPALQQTYPESAPLGLLESDTGELVWKDADKKEGVVTINAPATQGAIGFIGGKSESLGNVDIAVENKHAIVILTSLDGKPIQSAGRLLLVAHADYTSTGFAWEEDRRVVRSMGTHPMIIDPVKGTLGLKQLDVAQRVTITPLTGVGAPKDQSFNAVGSGANWSIALGNDHVSTWYLIEVAR